MRTRFRSIDYFSPSSSTETLGSFLKLPIPTNLPLPRLSFPLEEEGLLCSEPLPDPFLQIEQFPIEGVLSKFLSEVIPQRIHRDDTAFAEESNETASPRDHPLESTVPLFEAPEVLEFLDSICLPAEGIECLSEAPQIKQNLDLQMPDLRMHCVEEIQESVCLVRSDDPLNDNDQNGLESEVNDIFVPEHAPFSCTYPLLEVDEISLKDFPNLLLEDELLSFLKDIETLWTQDDNLVVRWCQIMGYVEYDILDIVSKHGQTKVCAESEAADASLAVDPISMVDGLMSAVNSGDYVSGANYFIFEELELLDRDSSQLCGAFLEEERAEELEACFWIFKEDEKSNAFNKLVVSRELALSDDSFTSLPVPLISDDDKIRSMEAILNDTLAVLKSICFSASDEIYLDWHLMEKEPSNLNILSPFRNILEELNSPANNSECESSFHGNLVTEIFISSDAITRQEKEQYEDLASILSEKTSNSRVKIGASRNSECEGCQKRGENESLVEGKARKASLLFKSMSQLDDLEFFLNPGKASTGPEKEKGTTIETNHKATCSKEGSAHMVPCLHENVDNSTSEEMQIHVSGVAKSNTSAEATDEAQSLCMPMPAPNICQTWLSEKNHGTVPPFHGSVIVVNTQNSDKEMIVSRRSAYRKVLAMEKEGLQVVERDLNLPVDIVLSPAICLVWYDHKNIGKKTTTLDESSSSLPMCIQNIATDILTSLSFSFSTCILVFEGEFSFLTIVMECSDSLYAAAASLGIELQLFCSYSVELTDNIITSSISSIARMFRDTYTVMPESETLAETFLTKFPSINPLTAHAILSCEALLFQFLGCSRERKINTVQKYRVPQESIALFSVLCRYGERDDSKSNMTDCSSSVSSGPASDKCQLNADHERKRRRCNPDSGEPEIFAESMWNYDLLHANDDKIQFSSRMIPGQDGWKLIETTSLEELKPRCSSSASFFGKIEGAENAWMMGSRPGPDDLSPGVKRPTVFLGDKILGRSRKSEISFDDELINPSGPENLRGDHMGEVLDLTLSSSPDTDVPSLANSADFSAWLPERRQSSRKQSRAIRKLSFEEEFRPAFPTAAELGSGSDFLTHGRDQRQSLQEKSEWPAEVKVPPQDQTKFPEDAFRSLTGRTFESLSFNAEMPQYGVTPLSKAINSVHPQPGSPWTIEFLNRIREKSRLHRQSLPCPLSTPSFRNSANVNKILKRRSPSIIEFFNYRGGATPTKLREQKKQEQFGQPSGSSKNARVLTASECQKWTPLEKRAKQTLAFTRSGTGSQTRLVWSDGSAHRLPKKLRPSS